jgi:hypothetical protein
VVDSKARQKFATAIVQELGWLLRQTCSVYGVVAAQIAVDSAVRSCCVVDVDDQILGSESQKSAMPSRLASRRQEILPSPATSVVKEASAVCEVSFQNCAAHLQGKVDLQSESVVQVWAVVDFVDDSTWPSALAKLEQPLADAWV